MPIDSAQDSQSRPNKSFPPVKPLAVGAAGLAKLLGISRRSVLTYDAAGLIPRPFKLGGRTLWNVSEVKRWLDAGSPIRDEWESIKAAA